MRTRLEPVHRIVQRVHRMPTGHRVELHDRRQGVAVALEVRDRLTRRVHGQIREEHRHPRPGRDDDRLRGQLVERVDAGVLLQPRSVCLRTVDERAMREIRTHDPGLGLEQRRPAIRHADGPALPGCFGRQQLVLRPRRVERVARALRRIVDELQQAVQLQQADAGLPLELAPTRKRLLRQLDELDLGICQTHDSRPPVARAARVADLELLVQRDLVPIAREGVRGCRAHDSRTDNRRPAHDASGTAICSRSSPPGPRR